MASRTPFGSWLRQRRHLLDYTQAELAAQCNCSGVTIRKLEAGDRKPSRELAKTLAGVLRIPSREQAAFIQFARSDDFQASFRLPAWEKNHPTWRTGQMPASGPPLSSGPFGASLEYDLVSSEAPSYEALGDGRMLFNVRAAGSVSGDIEGDISVRITQVIMPKPADVGYSQALPMQIAAFFTITSGEGKLEGSFTGTLSPMLDESGSGDARIQGTGQVISVTPGFSDLFLHYVFVNDIVKMVEGVGTGSRGTMQLKPVA